MSYLTARMTAAMWRIYHRTKYRPGQVVRNRYAAPWSQNLTLDHYVQPYIGWQEDHWGLSEGWRCKDGSFVAVGFFWEPIQTGTVKG